jgi:hypothetical protein
MVAEADLPRERAAGYGRAPAPQLLERFLGGQYDLAARIRAFARASAGQTGASAASR